MHHLTLALLLAGCGKNNAVHKAYEEARTAAFATPGPAPASWKPDVRVHVARPMLDALIERVLDERGAVTGTITKAGATLTPELIVEGLKLGPSNRCEDYCMAIDLDFGGTVTWSAGILGSGELPMSGSLAFDAMFKAEKDGEAWVISALPRDVRSAELRVQGWSGALKNLAEEPLRRWLDAEVVRRIEPIPVTTYEPEGLPLRALDVRATQNGLVIDLLTDLPGGGDVSAASASPSDGFVAHVAPQTLIAVARRAMFDAGPQTYDIVPEPTSLSVDKQTFTLGLRLWKTSGAGWWRDYSASGSLGVRGDAIALEARDVLEGEKSRGAELADPLFWIGEGLVQSAMTTAIAGSAPNVKRQKVGGIRTITKVSRIDGESGALRVVGSVTLPDGQPLDTRGKVKVRGKAKVQR